MGGESVFYAECRKIHADLNAKRDGCQEFMLADGATKTSLDCAVCGCHRNFHRRVVEHTPVKYVTEIVYTECHKSHNFYRRFSTDGCREFAPSGPEGTAEALTCAVCGCHKGFHRNEIRKEVPGSPSDSHHGSDYDHDF